MALSACGSSSGNSSTAKSSTASDMAEAQITKNWIAFFSPKTPAAVKVSLLQNGSKFAAVINAQSKSPLAKESSAKVIAVKLTGAKTATVTYTVLLAGTAALKNTRGTAVDTTGTWQVSDVSFCQLLKLEGSAPPACPKG
jgi:hypothetical protein